MFMLNAPHDPRLAPIWSTAMSRVIRAGMPCIDRTVQPVFDMLCQRMINAEGRIDPSINPFPKPEAFLPYEFPKVPGLRMRWAATQDVAMVVKVMVDRGGYTAPQALASVMDAVTNPLNWAFIWEWNGKPIQFESVTLNREGQIYLGVTVHITRERNHWFWRECERPLWALLQSLGYEYVQSAVKRDKGWWMETLKSYYKAVITDLHPKNEHLRVRMPLDLTIFQGFPERLSLGPDWRWSHGNLVVREGSEADMPTLRRVIPQLFRGMEGKDDAMRMLDEFYHLDRGTILIGEVSGKIRFARVIRPRRPGVANLTLVTPLSKTPEARAMIYASTTWFKQMGITTATSFVPQAEWEKPVFQEFLRHGHLKLLKHHAHMGFYEVAGNLEGVLRYSIEDWMAAQHYPREGETS